LYRYDAAIVNEELAGGGGLDEYCDEDPDADECKMFD
jgi:hypothetical protein